MIDSSLHSTATPGASRRAGSKVGARWLVALLLPGVILMASAAPLAASKAYATQVSKNANGQTVYQLANGTWTTANPEMQAAAAKPIPEAQARDLAREQDFWFRGVK
ncbi:MAG TPA: hypothetical protein VII20_05880 [Roseiarcus sp.]|jgi:hypothetical protein